MSNPTTKHSQCQCSLVGLSFACERCARHIDEHISEMADSYVWSARASHLRYLSVIFRSWAAELPSGSGETAEGYDSGIRDAEHLRMENDVASLRLQNQLLIDAMTEILSIINSVKEST